MTPAGVPARETDDRVGDLLRRRLAPAAALTAAAPWLRGGTPGPGVLVPGALALIWLGVLVGWAGRRAKLPAGRLLVIQLGADCAGLAALSVAGATGVGMLPLAYALPILLAALCLGPLAARATAGAAACVVGGLGVAAAAGLGQQRPGIAEVMAGSVLAVVVLLMIGRLAADLAERAASGRRLQSQAATQMQRARSEVRNVLDNIGSGLLLLDERGTVTRVNPAAGDILGRPAGELVGEPLAAALGPDGEALTACVMKVVEGGPPVSRQELTIRRLGHEVPIGISVSHQTDREERIVGAIAIFKDLSEICRMRDRVREADRLAAVGELAASIAHEIRNPLGSIRGSVEILAQELTLDGHQGRLLELVLKESARVNKIINDFLAFARLRPPEPRLLPCDEFLAEAALQVRQHIGAHGGKVELTHRVLPHTLQFFVDPEQMTQVLLNLAINACEAMDYRGSLLLSIEQNERDRWCELKVCDSGPGIDAAARDNLFKPFFTTKKGGTGLGLAMVSRIVHAHGGTVEADESPLGGAGFRVRVRPSGPRAEDEPAAGRPGESRPEESATPEPTLV